MGYTSAMNETLKCVKLCIDEDLKDKTNEDLCILYQQTKKDKYFAEVYKRIFADLFKIYKVNAPNLEEEIAASASLELVSDLMLEFDISKKTKFITLCHNGFYRRLYAEKLPYTRKKRKCTYKMLSLNSNYFDGDDELGDFVIDNTINNTLANIIFSYDLSTIDFNEIEKQILYYIINGSKLYDLKHIIKVDNSDILKSIKSIRKKLSMSKVI